ncbi:hypothetical protein [Legionella sp. km772]|uniref:hypothetical protein n=1 Tax=Legionella sp. km772 TaxID=2498111 RepID=UPI000F8DF1B1|nr:hypothetical protein [Legionella sp. km772]RUR04487.1 hypothetical protein ELY15_15445 [Legionella sp. km772]
MFKVNFVVLVGIITTLTSITFAQPTTQNITNLVKIESISTIIEQSRLPNPYNYLLTQTLMTKGIEKYYQRTPIIQPIYSELDKNNHIYSRAILMLLDNNRDRNSPALAQRHNETIVAELAFITINFNALPNNSCYARSILSCHIFKLLPSNLVRSKNQFVLNSKVI